MSTPKPSDLLIFLFSLTLCACERGCARRWVDERAAEKAAPAGSGSPVFNAIDCPDGLARCSGGVVQVSKLTSIPLPCNGPVEHCTCPWERAMECSAGCVADDVEVVLAATKAGRQLCAPPRDAAPIARVLPSPSPAACEEEQLYRCLGGGVVACEENARIATCVHGCVTEGAALDRDVVVSREAAFAILCSR